MLSVGFELAIPTIKWSQASPQTARSPGLAKTSVSHFNSYFSTILLAHAVDGKATTTTLVLPEESCSDTGIFTHSAFKSEWLLYTPPTPTLKIPTCILAQVHLCVSHKIVRINSDYVPKQQQSVSLLIPTQFVYRETRNKFLCTIQIKFAS